MSPARVATSENVRSPRRAQGRLSSWKCDSHANGRRNGRGHSLRRRDFAETLGPAKLGPSTLRRRLRDARSLSPLFYPAHRFHKQWKIPCLTRIEPDDPSVLYYEVVERIHRAGVRSVRSFRHDVRAGALRCSQPRRPARGDRLVLARGLSIAGILPGSRALPRPLSRSRPRWPVVGEARSPKAPAPLGTGT